MSSELAVCVQGLSKCYSIFDRPEDRLKQMFSLGRRKFYRDFWALQDVSFEVAKGETIGIVGRNGSGKSTLLQLLAGILTPTAGVIESRGRIAALLELGAGFSPEFTGRENIRLSGQLIGLSREEIAAREPEIISFAEIGEFIDQPVKTYSSGMFVRLAFAVHASVEPDILIIDEALAVGDGQFVHRCMARFRELQRRGTTIIVVSHDPSTIKRLCDRALWLKHGRLNAFGDVTAVVDGYVQDLFGLTPPIKANAPSSERGTNAGHTVTNKRQLPKSDGRLGARTLEFSGIRLTDSQGNTVGSVSWNEYIWLRLSIRNNGAPQNERFSCGYILRDRKGIEIASTNALMEDADLRVPPVGEEINIVFEILCPMLHPGCYSITPGVSSLGANGDFVTEDRLLNAVLVDVVTSQPIFTPLRLLTRIHHET